MIVVNGVSVEAVIWTLLALIGMWLASRGWEQAREDYQVEARKGTRASPTKLLLAEMWKTATGTRFFALMAFLVVGVASLIHGAEPRDPGEPRVSAFGILFEVLLFTALIAMVRASWLEIKRNEKLYELYDKDIRGEVVE